MPFLSSKSTNLYHEPGLSTGKGCGFFYRGCPQREGPRTSRFSFSVNLRIVCNAILLQSRPICTMKPDCQLEKSPASDCGLFYLRCPGFRVSEPYLGLRVSGQRFGVTDSGFTVDAPGRRVLAHLVFHAVVVLHHLDWGLGFEVRVQNLS